LGLSKKILQLGGRVVIASRKEEILKSSCQELESFVSTNQQRDLKKENKMVSYKTVDVRDGWSVCELFDFVEEEMNCLPNVIVNNAAGFTFCNSYLLKDEEWMRPCE